MSIPLFAVASSHCATTARRTVRRAGAADATSRSDHLRPRPSARTVPGSYADQLVGEGVTEDALRVGALTAR
ncbi:hypothetical protein [Streptomyces sp. NPDC005181]|uniref:hypothetical protein n=1 Tax=Streptomyces sp. NPDC005181 TaxID=3156869 RepID=UPI0033A22D99